MPDSIVVERTHPSMPQNPVDPNVRVPDSVKRAAAAADAIHKQAYTPTAPAAEPVTEPVVAAPAAPAAPETPVVPAAPVQPEPVVTAPAASAEPVVDDNTEPVTAEQWKHRFLSMQGRFNAQKKINGAMEEQMTQLGEELMRTQALIQQAPPAPTQDAQPTPLITEEDRTNYGNDIIDLAQRAAKAAVGPELESLKQRNATLEQTLQRASQSTVTAALDQQVPNWREINKNPRFVRGWLRLRDIYSGRVRSELLNEAFAAANAPRVVAFFKGFITDETATGNLETPETPASQPTPAPRVAAVPLETLAAPGRAKPATGNASVAADKPIFTRAQVSQFYKNVSKGAYNGRDAERARDEAAIFAAQADGRIQG